jgi:hypothetical protein
MDLLAKQSPMVRVGKAAGEFIANKIGRTSEQEEQKHPKTEMQNLAVEKPFTSPIEATHLQQQPQRQAN